MSLAEYALAVLGSETDAAGFATHSFVGLGGDSLRAMRLSALVQEHRGVRIPVAELLSSAPLATVLANADMMIQPAGPTTGADADAGDPVALSATQRGMWMVERIVGGSTYNLVFTCFVERGTLDRGTFER